MKVSFVGYEGKGTWQIRAKQIAPFIKARLDPNLLKPSECDAVILIKRPPENLLRRIQKFNKPIIWDIQDSWFQKKEDGNMSAYEKADIMKWLKDYLDIVKPIHVIATTSVMKKDLNSLGYSSTIINHFHRPNIQINPIREQLKIVGIEGTVMQYGQWPSKLKNICKKKNYVFLENFETSKDKLHTFDAVIAIREHTGYAATNWKSNVKLANAHGSGTPGIFGEEQSYKDTASGFELWASNEDQVLSSLEYLEPYDIRKNISENFIKNKISIEQIAEDYKALIDSL